MFDISKEMNMSIKSIVLQNIIIYNFPGDWYWHILYTHDGISLLDKWRFKQSTRILYINMASNDTFYLQKIEYYMYKKNKLL